MNTEKIEVIHLLATVILEIISDADSMGVPSGRLYAELMTTGCSKIQYDQFVSTLASSGMIRQEQNFCLHITEAGKDFLEVLHTKYPLN